MSFQLHDRLLLAQVVVLEGARTVGQRIRERFARIGKDERGQTPTEYLMIAGLMAVIIIIAFVTYFWENVKVAAKAWTGNVQQAINGQKIGT